MRYFLLLLSLFFLGCSPKYVLKNHYIPSSKEGFVGCVQECDSKRDRCEKEAVETYEICRQDAYNRTKDIYQIELIAYEKEYTLYLKELNFFSSSHFSWQNRFNLVYQDYKYFLDKCHKHKDSYACARQGELDVNLKDLRLRKPLKPREPLRLNFNEMYEKELLTCKASNNCLNEYDKCYTSCGGEVVPYRICVENCD